MKTQKMQAVFINFLAFSFGLLQEPSCPCYILQEQMRIDVVCFQETTAAAKT